jgi:hypothetical protein
MTFGYRPENWPAFEDELQRRGIAPGDIERVELRPPAEPGSEPTVDVTVTTRSGLVESWTHPQQPQA